MNFTERLHLTRVETIYALALPLLGIATVVSIIISFRTAPGFLTWCRSVINIAMFVSIEVVLVKNLSTLSESKPAISTRAAIEVIVGSAAVVVLGTILVLIAIGLLSGNERTLNDAITALVGPVLIWVLVGVNLSHRSRLNRPREAG